MRLLVAVLLSVVSLSGSVAWADFFGEVLAGSEAGRTYSAPRSPDYPQRPRPPAPPERPGRPDRPDRPGRPDYPNRPEYPGRPDPGYGGGGWGRNLTCSAADFGHEEHWYKGGHSTCGDCLKYHGHCIETCSESMVQYTCQFEGQNDVGRREVFIAEDMDRRYAEQTAENRCYRAGYRSCRYLGCNTREQKRVVSRRDCPGSR